MSPVNDPKRNWMFRIADRAKYAQQQHNNKEGGPLAGEKIPEEINGHEARQEDKDARNDRTGDAAQIAMVLGRRDQLLCGHPLEIRQNHEQKSDEEQRGEPDRQLMGFR